MVKRDLEKYELCNETLIRVFQEKEFSRSKVASELGVSLKTIQRWLNNQGKRVGKDQLIRLAGVL